ncbi:MAG: dihydrofolate reductase family protein, partial [Bosea sp. (in: a-proteobacteria)]
DKGRDGKLDILAALTLLAARGITRVFSEGGPTLGAAMAERGLADTVIVSTADHAYGQAGTVALLPPIANRLRDSSAYRQIATDRFGTDVFATYEKVT